MKRNAARPKAVRRYEFAEHVLRDNILSGRLPVGLVLLEVPISKILQMSRAPIQRALLQLETEGLIHRFDGRGFLVGQKGVAPDRTNIKKLGLAIPDNADTVDQGKPAWSRIYDIIEHDVASCVAFGKYRMIETEIAEHFGVSRTVVRDLLSRLHERGLVRKNRSSHWIAGPLKARTVKDHFALRRILEPAALQMASGEIDRAALGALLSRITRFETSPGAHTSDELETLQAEMVELCILSVANDQVREVIRKNLLPLTATHHLLRRLGLPGEVTAATEIRLVVELILQGAVAAAGAMLEAHLDASTKRMIAQMKLVSIIPGPNATASYLLRIE